jgi:hypothetical protein
MSASNAAIGSGQPIARRASLQHHQEQHDGDHDLQVTLERAVLVGQCRLVPRPRYLPPSRAPQKTAPLAR